MSEQTHPLAEYAEEVYQATRSMCHEPAGALPAPTLYEILGSLYAGAHALPQALDQMAYGLKRSLTEYEVTEYDEGKNPTESVLKATGHLSRAGELAAELGRELEAAQLAINGQGYSSRRPAKVDGNGRVAEHKAWQAHASEAIEYFQAHGGDAMTAEERATYEALLGAAQDAAGPD